MSSAPRAGLPDGRALGTDRFTIERKLGEGSMGAVFLAHDRELQTRVALKTLRRVDPSGIYRFKREFRALADVSHPNLVQFYELFSAATEWFFTMEYVEGRDFLTDLLGSAPKVHETVQGARSTRQGGGPRARGLEVLFPSPLQDEERLRSVLRQVTEGLMAVHAAGKLHRDLKPDNVLVTDDGRAVVLDFGITFELHQDSHGTMEAGVMGTPAYMSPEQAAGDPVTEATDFYALGAMLYEALTGQVPFDGSFMEVLRSKQRIDPRPPSELVSNVAPELNTLCMRLLSRDASDRPTGSEVLEALGGDVQRVSIPPAPKGREIDPSLYGREGQLAELQRALSVTAEGSPSVVLVHGTTGMGKSTLVERFLDAIQEVEPAVVLSGRCYEHEMVPFKALDSVIDALSRYLARLPPTEASEVMPKDVNALAQLFPVLRRVDAVQAARRRSRRVAEPRILRRLAGQALKELLTRIAMRDPLVLFIDDLQWGDVDSARLIADLVSGPEHPALLLVCTYRTADRERSQCLKTLFSLLRERTALDLREVSVQPLTEQERVELARRLLGSEGSEHVLAVARESRGSPYLLTQLVDHVRSERARLAPGDRRLLEISLDRAVAGRLETLSPQATSVLELAAVAGRPVRDEIVARLVAEDMDLGAALTELRRARLVRGVGSGDQRAIAIYDESIRDAALARMAEGLIRNWHRRLATALENSSDPDLEALTDHLLGAEDTARAGIYAIRAASQALQALAFDKAADLYEIAVRHHEDDAWRQELLLQWADALVSAGRSTRAADVYLEAAQNAPDDAAIDLKRKAGVQLLMSGRWTRGTEAVGPAITELGLKFPADGGEALKMTAELLPKLQERGLELKTKPRAKIPTKTLERLDALWSVVQATFSTNPVIAQPFTLHYLMEALDAGDRSRAAVGLCAYFVTTDLAFSSLAGHKPKTLQAAEAIARDLDDARVEGWVSFARAFAYLNDGLLKPAALELMQAHQIFRDRCTQVTPEQRSCQMLYARALAMLGQFEDFGVTEAWIREADETEDLLTATRLRLTTLPRILMDDDVLRAQRALQIPPDVQSDPFDLTQLLVVLSRSALAMYVDDAVECAQVLAAHSALRSSPLFGIRVWRSDFLLTRVRLLLAMAKLDPEPESRFSEIERLIETAEKIAVESHVDLMRMSQAGLANRRGQRDEALRWLNTILSDADMGGESRLIRACALLRKGELLADAEGAELIRQAEQELKTRGVKDPARFARIYSAGFS